jgi:hypothetical protein
MRVWCVLALLCLLLATTGCALVVSPAFGGLYTDVKWGGEVTSNAGASKSGSGEAMSVLGLVAVGDASVETAARKANITKIHHVDYHSWSILGIFGRITTTVYGE